MRKGLLLGHRVLVVGAVSRSVVSSSSIPTRRVTSSMTQWDVTGSRWETETDTGTYSGHAAPWPWNVEGNWAGELLHNSLPEVW